MTDFATNAPRYSCIDFAPRPAVAQTSAYNLFNGFHLKPQQGDCSDLKAFILEVICAGNDQVFKWVWHWLAHMLQRPGEKPGTALVIHGEGRSGKGTFGELVSALVYPYAMLVSDSKEVLGPFAGARLANRLLCIAEEAFFAGNKSETNKLKSCVTAPIQTVEQKHMNAFEVPSYIRYIFDSNEDHVVNIEGNGSEDRFCVMKISPHKRGDLEYFKKIHKQIKGPEIAVLAHELLNYDPADAGMEWSDVRTAPETKDRKRMGYASRTEAERVLLQVIEEGRFEFRGNTDMVEYELDENEPTRISSQHCRDFMKPFKNPHVAGSDNILKIAEKIFGRNHGFEKDKAESL